MMKKMTLYSIIFFTYLCTNVSGQSSYGFKDLQVIRSLDSMERVIPKLNKNSLDYIKHLIAIEHSRIEYFSFKSGKYINEIDSLSKIRSFEFGIGFVQYYKCVSLSKSPNMLKQTLIYGESAIKSFKKLKDSMGIFLIHNHTIKITQAVLLYPKSTSGNEPENLFQSTKSIQKLYTDLYANLFISTEAFVKRQKKPYYTIHWNNTKSSIELINFDNSPKARQKMDTVVYYMHENLRIINKNPIYRQYLHAIYAFLGNSYTLKDSLEKGLYYSKLAKNSLECEESIYRVLYYLNLVRELMQMNEKKNIDPIYNYTQEALSIVERDDFKSDSKIILQNACLRALVKVYESRNDYKNASLVLNKIVQGQSLYVNDLLAQSISSYFEFEKIRQQEIQNKELKEENRISNQRNWFGLIILSIICFALYFILKNYFKLKRVKNEIELLQKEREKFYTIVSHDLRSPMESYQGLASTISFLIKQKKYEDLSQIAVQIDKTGIKLKNLIGNLLAWSLEQQNLIDIQIEPVNVLDVLEHLVPIYQPIITKKEIELHQKIGEDFILQTDKNLVNTILRNAIDNATKHAPEKSTITILASKELHADAISISNIATLSDDQFKTIQELFTPNNSWQAGHKGLGLGLFLIRDFTRKLGIQAEVSYQDNIFTFRFAFPR